MQSRDCGKECEVADLADDDRKKDREREGPDSAILYPLNNLNQACLVIPFRENVAATAVRSGYPHAMFNIDNQYILRQLNAWSLENIRVNLLDLKVSSAECFS